MRRLRLVEVKVKKKSSIKDSKLVKFGNVLISMHDTGDFVRIQINFGRFKKDVEIDTNTIYCGCEEGGKDDEVWGDFQGKDLIGVYLGVAK